MSRTPGQFALTVVRGSTWEDYFDYTDSDGVPIDLTNYEARMQVRTIDGQFGTTTTTTLLMELLTTGSDPLLQVTTPPGGSVMSRVSITASPLDHAALNPQNIVRETYVYGLELYVPAGVEPEYVIPLVNGRVRVNGQVAR